MAKQPVITRAINSSGSLTTCRVEKTMLGDTLTALRVSCSLYATLSRCIGFPLELEKSRSSSFSRQCDARNMRSHLARASGIGKSAELDLDFGEWVFRVAWSRVRRMRITFLSKSRSPRFNASASPARQPVRLRTAYKVE